jgi:flavin-dependent dehydrogenase
VRVTAIERRDGDWIVNGAHRTPLLVGAGGHFCPVARHLAAAGGARARRRVVAAQEIEIAVPDAEAAALPDAPEFLFCDDLLGYGWIFRKGAYLNVGFGRQDPHGFPSHAARFRQVLADRGDVPSCALRNPWNGHAYLLAPDGRAATGDGVMLVGDAAGLADPRSGEGIRTAIESGLLAAAAAIDAGGRYTQGRLAGYTGALRVRFGHGHEPAATRWIPPALARAAARVLLRSKTFTRRVVLDRWFLHRWAA